MKTNKGTPVELRMCFMPVRYWGEAGLEGYRQFWCSVAKDAGIKIFDLTDSFMALGDSCWPLDSKVHFTADGTDIFAYSVVHFLIRDASLPMGRVAHGK